MYSAGMLNSFILFSARALAETGLFPVGINVVTERVGDIFDRGCPQDRDLRALGATW